MDEAAMRAVTGPTFVVLAQNDEFVTPDQDTKLATAEFRGLGNSTIRE